MSNEYDVTAVNRVRQIPRKARYDRSTVNAILDAGLCAHAAFVQDGAPVVVPMLFGRDGDTLYLHGARKARIVRLLERSERVCVNVTLLDGIVVARSMFNCSMNYRSVTVFGTPSLVEGHDAKLAAMRVISERLLPGRWDEARPSHEREVKMTGVIALAIESASAKVSEGMPVDEDEDYRLPIWAGIVPLTARFGALQPDDRLADGAQPSPSLAALVGRTL